MWFESLLNSDTGLALAATIFGSIWALFKASEWGRILRRERYREALQALEAAVDETYHEYVEAIKNSREDGQLTADEKRRARLAAREKAIIIARERGVELLDTIGRHHVDTWIAKIVKRLKRPARQKTTRTQSRRLNN